MRRGRRVVLESFVVLVAPSAEPKLIAGSRLGITVSRQVGDSVVRNRVKRRIREWFRRAREELDPSSDVLVIGRVAAARLSSKAVAETLDEAARRLGVRAP
jgi:ribonuclease P protein component